MDSGATCDLNVDATIFITTEQLVEVASDKEFISID